MNYFICYYFTVTITDYPLQAVELLRANKGNYDIVLIDVNLTCMDGFELVKNVSREISLPVIGMLKFSKKNIKLFYLSINFF
ncbi:Two-component response regulator ARR12 [Dendrobium catenatum]|uniref:Two-component response regulator ARR12 n=1 Tax=Dendrobium catenatum TaxID=906689 RepID=A0A2I0VFN5_9ASPA|nr:Two-component response regulator ARR12 [Dendrobium catenatum]